MRTIFAVLFILLATQSIARELTIICTYEGSFDQDGYSELQQSTFRLTVTEDSYGNAVSASWSDGGICQYTTIAEYNDKTILLNGCQRPRWVGADEELIGYLEVDRYSGAFKRYSAFSDTNVFLMFVGSCRAASKKF